MRQPAAESQLLRRKSLQQIASDMQTIRYLQREFHVAQTFGIQMTNIQPLGIVKARFMLPLIYLAAQHVRQGRTLSQSRFNAKVNLCVPALQPYERFVAFRI